MLVVSSTSPLSYNISFRYSLWLNFLSAIHLCALHWNVQEELMSCYFLSHCQLQLIYISVQKNNIRNPVAILTIEFQEIGRAD